MWEGLKSWSQLKELSFGKRKRVSLLTRRVKGGAVLALWGEHRDDVWKAGRTHPTGTLNI